MKRMSLKLKLTLIYTFFMMLVTCVALGILFSLSNKEVLSSKRMQLQKHVQESMEDIGSDAGKLKVDSDFYNLEDNIYLSLYGTNGDFLYGRVPYGFDKQPDFQDGRLRTITENSSEWFVFDLEYYAEDYGPVYIRGITSVTRAEESFLITLRFAMIILPLLVILTAIINRSFKLLV